MTTRVTTTPTPQDVWRWLGDVPDPEVPAVSVVDLGIVRDVAWVDGADGATLEVTVTPTYSGCPATAVIARDIERALRERGVGDVRLRTQLDPPWTTDWLSVEGREKLRAYGIAPPVGTSRDVASLGARRARRPPVACPRCASTDTSLVSEFGSTPCKSLHRCDTCAEPFDHFKCH